LTFSKAKCKIFIAIIYHCSQGYALLVIGCDLKKLVYFLTLKATISRGVIRTPMNKPRKIVGILIYYVP
jgi:hypothetical protein